MRYGIRTPSGGWLMWPTGGDYITIRIETANHMCLRYCGEGYHVEEYVK